LLVFVTPHIVDPVHVESAVAQVPKMPVPLLDVNRFDDQTASRAKKSPDAEAK
jgi:hypothetical protein